MGVNKTKQASWIAVGSLFSFGFGIVSSMILSRYFDKADYGTYKQVLYVYNTLLSVFTLGLPKAYSYFLPRVDNNQAKSLIKKLTNLFFLLGSIFSILLFAGATIIARWMNNPDLALALRIFSIVPILLLPTMGLEGILSTYQRTKFMALYTVLTRTFMLMCVALPVMFFNVGYIGAIIGFVVSSAISCALALYLKYLPVRNEGDEQSSISIREIFRFSLPILYASLWGTIIHSADQFFVSRYFGREVFAEFANGSTELPFVGMILGACSAVLSPIFSRMSHERVDPKKEVFPIWMSVFEKTAKLTYPIVLFCWFFADSLMTVLYGGKYEVSHQYFRIKLLTYFFTLIVYAPLLINIGKVKYYARVHMWTAIVVVVLEYISVITVKSPYAISIVSMLCQFGKAIALLWAVSRYFGTHLYELFPIKLILKIILPSISFLLLERWVMAQLLENASPLLFFTIGLLVYVVVYYIYSVIIKLDYLSIVKPLFKK